MSLIESVSDDEMNFVLDTARGPQPTLAIAVYGPNVQMEQLKLNGAYVGKMVSLKLRGSFFLAKVMMSTKNMSQIKERRDADKLIQQPSIQQIRKISEH